MTRQQRGRLALGVAILCATLALSWRVRHPEGPGGARTSSPPRSAATGAGHATADDAAAPTLHTGAPTRTVRDRAVRDVVRAHIASDWAARGAPGAPAAHAPAAPEPGPSAAPPRIPEPGRELDAPYIRERIRADFAPMAQQCYEELLSRRPGESARVTMSFRIVGDPRWGGVVDEAFVDVPDGGTVDPELARCMRESMLAMAFRPPAEGGAVQVRYPFVMQPGAAQARSSSDPP